MAIAVTIQRAFHAIFFLVATSAVADQHQCSDSILVIHEHRFDALGAVCDGAEAARVFLRAAGFAVAEPIAIEIVDRLPVEVDRHAVACYVDPEHRVYLLPPSKIAGLGSSGIDPVDQFPYRSRVAHEVAHAIAAMNFRVSRPTIQAHEYIAYVTMFATMSAEVRAQLLSALPGRGFETADQINATLFLLAPTWFGAEAYRHYRSLGDGGRDFLRRILVGQVLQHSELW
jgi:hypothetical protein